VIDLGHIREAVAQVQHFQIILPLLQISRRTFADTLSIAEQIRLPLPQVPKVKLKKLRLNLSAREIGMHPARNGIDGH
jgi:hypothetical protein